MIRVHKTKNTPPSLQVENCNHYDGQDVQESLYSDQNGKCYLCEQETHKTFQIEHLKAKAEGFYPDLEYSWTNLFLVCGYCNGRKPNNFEIIDPTVNNVEDLVIHRIDLYAKKVEFQSLPSVIDTQHTIDLLTRLFNGKTQIRDKRGQILFEDLNREISNFLEMLLEYKSMPNEKNKQIIIDLLHITKEFLGFKYWIIRDAGMYDLFKEYMVWNKTK